jgi:membrane protease YdiL (CAAX protease family)
MNSSPKLILNLRQRLLLFACIAIIGYFLASIISYVLTIKSGLTTPTARIAVMMQDVFALVVPAIVTAVVITRRPAEFLAVKTAPQFKSIIIAILTLIAATPAMNLIIHWNESISLPESMSAFEQELKMLEESSRLSVQILQGENTVLNLIVSILIIGVAAGFSEELFFRGTLQNLIHTGGYKSHYAIWITAIVFSALHLQFYGFVPRILLGAYFGYVLIWTRSLWVPISVHAFNNIAYIVAQWVATAKGEPTSQFDEIGTGSSWFFVPVSILLAVCGLTILYRDYRKNLISK